MEQLPTPLFWSGEFQGLYSPWGCKESDRIDFHFHLMEKNPASRISLSLPEANLPSKDLDVATLQTQDGLLPKIGFGGQDWKIEDWLAFLLCLGDGAGDRVCTKKEAWVVWIHPPPHPGNKGRNTQAFWPLPTRGEEEGRMLRSCQKTSKKKKKKKGEQPFYCRTKKKKKIKISKFVKLIEYIKLCGSC